VSRPTGRRADASQAARQELAAYLRSKAPQIENAIIARIRDLGEPLREQDAAYLAGLKSALKAALEYAFEIIEMGDEPCAPLPLELAKQARRAAREGVRLDTVLRRFAAGNNLLEGFIVAEAPAVPPEVLRKVLRDQGPQVDRVMELVVAEYRDELALQERSAAQRQADRVLRLLADDDLSSPAGLDYDFDAWHVGVILQGTGTEATAALLAERLGCSRLLVPRDGETLWLWLGTRQRERFDGLGALLDHAPAGTSAATGEPRHGLAGWRLTHREAQIGLQIMLRRPRKVTRGRDVVLIAGVLRDEALIRSLLDNYLAPLERPGDSGRALFETLRAYFSSGGNAAAAAASVGITRQTVQRRIKTVEERLGQPLHECQAALEVALAIDELGRD
jgi:hypothetical protein